jgi:hypothetical protein
MFFLVSHELINVMNQYIAVLRSSFQHRLLLCLIFCPLPLYFRNILGHLPSFVLSKFVNCPQRLLSSLCLVIS